MLRRSSSGYWVINGACVRLGRRWSEEGEEPCAYGILDKTEELQILKTHIPAVSF